MENKEHVTELKIVQEKTRKATHATESMGANIMRTDIKDQDLSI